MKWLANTEALKPRKFEIKQDPLVGFYLYIFENEKCIRDHLENTQEIAMDVAFEDYNVPKDAWKAIE